MELVLPALGLTADVQGVIRGINYATYMGKKSYDVVKMVTGGQTGVRELTEGIVKKGVTGSGVAPLVGSNKVLVGSAKNFTENKEMPQLPTPSRTPAAKKRKAKTSKSKSSKSKKVKVAKKSKPYKPRGVSEGRASGSMGKKVKTQNFNQFHKLGYVTQSEKYGSVADANCVYIYHSTYEVDAIVRSIIASLYRKLFKIAGVEVVNELDELKFQSLDSSDVRIQYTDANIVNGTLANYVFDIGNNVTFKSLIDNTCVYSTGTIFQKLVDTMFNATLGDGNDGRIPYYLMFQVKDTVVLNNEQSFVWRNHAVLNLQNERVVLMSKSALTVQNRTKGSNAAAADYDDQRVDNQPLKGKLYEFCNGDPRLKQQQMHIQPTMPVPDGYEYTVSSGSTRAVRAFGGTTIGTNSLMREPPPSKIWKNVKKCSQVLLQPGDIKRSVISVNYDLTLPDLLTKFRVVSSGSATYGTGMYTQLKSHKSQILALEEVLRTPGDNPINCTYEVEITVGAYCYSKKSKSYFRAQQFEENVPQWAPA